MLSRRRYETVDGRELIITIEVRGNYEATCTIEDQDGKKVEEETLSAEDRKLLHAIVFDACDDEHTRADRDYAVHVDK